MQNQLVHVGTISNYSSNNPTDASAYTKKVAISDRRLTFSKSKQADDSPISLYPNTIRTDISLLTH